MAVVTICSDFETHQNKVSLFPLFPYLFAMKWWDQMPWSSFSECWVLTQLFHSSFTFTKRLFSSSSLSAMRVVSSAYLRWLIFLPAILIPACVSDHTRLEEDSFRFPLSYLNVHESQREGNQMERMSNHKTTPQPFRAESRLCVNSRKSPGWNTQQAATGKK